MLDVQRRARRKLVLVCSSAALALSAQAARADEAGAVSEVVITGDLEQTLPQEIARSGSRLTIVTAQQIEAGNYLDVGQALNLVPGLSLIPQSGPFSYNTASFQGSRPSEIVYLVDGVRISNRLYNTTPPLDTIPAHVVDRIEVLEGGQSLFFGTQAVAGAINIVTRPFTDDLTGQLQASANTNRGIALNGYASGAAGGNRFVVYASHDEGARLPARSPRPTTSPAAPTVTAATASTASARNTPTTSPTTCASRPATSTPKASWIPSVRCRPPRRSTGATKRSRRPSSTGRSTTSCSSS